MTDDLSPETIAVVEQAVKEVCEHLGADIGMVLLISGAYGEYGADWPTHVPSVVRRLREHKNLAWPILRELFGLAACPLDVWIRIHGLPPEPKPERVN